MKTGDIYVIKKDWHWYGGCVGDKLIYVGTVPRSPITVWLRQDGTQTELHLDEVQYYLSPLDPPQ